MLHTPGILKIKRTSWQMAGAQEVVVLQAFPFLQTRCPSQPGHGHTPPKERQNYTNQHTDIMLLRVPVHQ